MAVSSTFCFAFSVSGVPQSARIGGIVGFKGYFVLPLLLGREPFTVRRIRSTCALLTFRQADRRHRVGEEMHGVAEEEARDEVGKGEGRKEDLEYTENRRDGEKPS